MNQQPSPRYDAVSRAFHWVTAIVVTIAFILGPGGFGRMTRQGIDPGTRSDIVWHETLGILVLVLTVLRLVWVALRPAAPTFDMARWSARRCSHLPSRGAQGRGAPGHVASKKAALTPA